MKNDFYWNRNYMTIAKSINEKHRTKIIIHKQIKEEHRLLLVTTAFL